MRRNLFRYVLFSCALLVLLELGLRLFLDNSQRILYQKDPACEYRLVPDQNISRFHNSYVTNSYGMRSSEITKNQKIRILLFGDSVLNGGSKIDQSDLLSEKLEQRLRQFYNVDLVVCNISANSWGPENAFRYFENYVDFDFDLMLLMFSSHDYHDNMHFRDVVGIEPAWPSEQPYLALTDVFTGFVFPKFQSFFGSKYDYLKGFDDSRMNPGWSLFNEYSKSNGIPIMVYLHPTSDELRNKNFSSEGNKIIEFLVENNIDFINGLNVEKEIDYVDDIHINSNGHRSISDTLYDIIIQRKVLSIKSIQ